MSTTDTDKHASMDHWILVGMLVVSVVVSILCLIRLWRRSDSVFEKIFWTLLVPIPVLGPLFFVAFFRPPDELPDGETASVNASAFYGGPGR